MDFRPEGGQMKRLIRFVLLTLGYFVALIKVAGRVIVRTLRERRFGPKKTAVFGALAAILAVALSMTFATSASANTYTEGTRSLTWANLGGPGGGLNASPVSCGAGDQWFDVDYPDLAAFLGNYADRHL
jgi:hypothetical protein